MSTKLWKGKVIGCKVRNFTFTNYYLEFNYEELIQDNQIAYIAYGEEICPKTKNQHHQGFISFHNPKSWSIANLVKIGLLFSKKKTALELMEIKDEKNRDLKKKLINKGSAHIEPMAGSMAQNESYCSKESNLKEFGERPKQGNRSDLKENTDMILSGETTVDKIVCEDPMLYHQYGRTLEKVQTIALRKQARTEMTKGIWYFGGSGLGKSHKAFEDFNVDTHYIVDTGQLSRKFWTGYTGQPIVIINEFRGQCTFSELNELVDKWPKKVDVKGTEPVPFLAREVRITGPASPEDTYSNKSKEDGSFYQFYRRFQVYEFSEKFKEPIERTWKTAEAYISKKNRENRIQTDYDYSGEQKYEMSRLNDIL
jgi:hypothetical protein